MSRWMTAFLLLALLLGGCAGGPKPSPAPEVPQQADPTPPQQPPAAPAQPVGGAPEWIKVAQATPLLQVAIKPGEPVNRAGLFFLDVKSSAVEGWVTAGNDWTNFTVSPDNRWVTAGLQSETLLVDRQSGAIYSLDQNQAQLVAARENTLLFQTASSFWVTVNGMNGPFAQVAIAPANTAPPAAVVARDGRSIFVLNGTQLHRIESGSGKANTLHQIESPVKGAELNQVSLTPGPKGEGAVLTAWFTQVGRSVFQVLRYGADGTLVDNQIAPGEASYSPDGKLVAWHESIHGLTQAVVIGSERWEPKLRLRGEARSSIPLQGPYWLSDSSGIVINTTRGPRLLTMDGTLESLAAAGAGWGVPVPAPDRTDLFAVDGVTVVDRAGNKIAAAAPTGGTLGNLGPWGDQSTELRFVLRSGGKGVSGDPMIFAPVVDRAPFPAIAGLTVKVAAGDCVNLRQAFSKEAPVVTCLPDGARLIPAEPPGVNNKGELRKWGNPASLSMGGEWWWYVRTEKGQRGWVYLSEEYLTWTVAKPGDPTPDLLANRVEDELLNMRFWLGVGTGEVECGLNCQGSGGVDALWGLKSWCETGPATLRSAPGFDSARHGAGVIALESTCQGLTASAVSLETPEGQQAWVKRAKELLQGLKR